jgi:hypothetical protein
VTDRQGEFVEAYVSRNQFDAFYSVLAKERAQLQLYATQVASARRRDLRERWFQFFEAKKARVQLLTKSLEAHGLDPWRDRPKADPGVGRAIVLGAVGGRLSN